MAAPGALRVLWLTTAADSDGPGRALLALLHKWPAADAVAVFALRSVTASFRRECAPSLELHEFGLRGLWDAPAMARLVGACRRWQPDVIHTQLSRADWLGRVVSRALGVPVVSTIQNVHSRMYRAEFPPIVARGGLLLDRMTSRLAARLVAVSDGVARDLAAHGVPAARIEVIHNGLDLDRRRLLAPRADVRRAWGCSTSDIVVGTTALLKTQKGIPFLIDAAEIATRANAAVRFVHIGDGPLGDEVGRRTAAAGLGDRFRLLHRIDEPMTLLSGFDIFVLPSLWEGLPIAMLEAMSAGLPLIGTAVPGIEDIVTTGRTGVLVPPADPAALAAAILDLAADPAERGRLGRAAEADLPRFDAAVIAERYRELDASLVGERKASGRLPRPVRSV